MSKIQEFLRFIPRDPKLLTLKRRLYVALFICLGLMVAYFMYVLSTVATIFLLLLDFGYYGLGWTWKTWIILGRFWMVLCLLGGVVAGYGLGVYWWRYIYIDKKLKLKC